MTESVPDAPTVDDLAPQLVVRVADRELGPLGYLVLDRSLASAPAGGGIRVAPGLTLDEIAGLARAMTLKWAFLNLPHGGAKGGITVPPELLSARREDVMTAFGRALRPLLERKVYFTGTDLGTTLEDIAAVRRGYGAPPPAESVRNGGRSTAATVIEAVKQCAAHRGLPLADATVAIEGFGRVGREIGVRLTALGARVVAVSTRADAVHDANGLDVPAVVAAAETDCDGWIRRYSNGDRLEPAELLALPVDVLVPCARSWTVNATNVDAIRAQMIVPAANTPVTPGALRALAAREVLVMPDFVANCGGILHAHMAYRGFDFSDFAQVVETVLAERFRRLLEQARQAHEPPTELAERIAWRNFEEHRTLLEEHLPPSAVGRQFALLRRHGVAAVPTRLAGELHTRPRLRGAVPRRPALSWFIRSTLGAELDS